MSLPLNSSALRKSWACMTRPGNDGLADGRAWRQYQPGRSQSSGGCRLMPAKRFGSAS